jgi:hypothetical protein
LARAGLRVRRLLAVSTLLAVGAVVGASPAAADPARPTTFRSEIERIEPDVEGVTVEVVGGDAFLRVTAEPGRTVAVPGYGGEPWLRIGPDGRVEQNRASSATYLNDSRDGVVPVPDGVGPDAEPEWEVVATDGSWAWHDHRVHYMGTGTPAVEELADGTRRVQEWTVPIAVDGTDVVVEGRLVLLDLVVPVLALVVALVAGALAYVLGRRRPGPTAAVASAVAAVVALAVGIGEWVLQPAGAGASVLVLALPALGVVAAVVAVVLAVRGRSGSVAVLGAVALLAGWGLMRVSVLWHPELPTVLPAEADRTGVAVVLALAAVAGALATRAPARRAEVA